jgi:D-alanyl-D-alanine carboxypeptidase
LIGSLVNNRFRPFALLSLPGALIAASPIAAQPAAPFLRNVESCFAAQASLTPFAGIVGAERGGDRFVQAAGTVDGTAAPTHDRRYRLASVGKVFTAVAIGRLVDQGRIRLDAPIGTYLPGLPPAIAAVTVEQLLHHRSGVAPLHFMTPAFIEARRNAHTARDLLPLVINEPLAFAPGSQTEYSNGGYFVLGAIIEEVSGRNYSDYLQSEIFNPLGMTASGIAADAGTAMPMSRMQGPGAPPLAAPAPMRGFPEFEGNPAGDSVSTIDDLLRLGRALVGDRLISGPTKALIFPRRQGAWRIGQAGGRPGGNTYFMAFPETGTILVVLTNFDPPAGELMGEALGGLLGGGACHPLSATDRPSPMIIRHAPPGTPPGAPASGQPQN